MNTSEAEEIRSAVRDRYASAARSVADAPSCGAPGMGIDESFGAGLYAVDQTDDLPPAAVLASLGCGNPTALATLLPGQTVLDLGSGAGSMCCSRPVGSGRPARFTAWT